MTENCIKPFLAMEASSCIATSSFYFACHSFYLVLLEEHQLTLKELCPSPPHTQSSQVLDEYLKAKMLYYIFQFFGFQKHPPPSSQINNLLSDSCVESSLVANLSQIFLSPNKREKVSSRIISLETSSLYPQSSTSQLNYLTENVTIDQNRQIINKWMIDSYVIY